MYMKHIIIFILIIVLFLLVWSYIKSSESEPEPFSMLEPHDMPSIINPNNCDKVSLEPSSDEVISDKENKRINLYKVTRNNTNYKFIVQKDFKQDKLPVVQTYLELPPYKSANIELMEKYGVIKKDEEMMPLTLSMKETKKNFPVNNFYGYNYSFQ
jgi:hypothetical protein